MKFLPVFIILLISVSCSKYTVPNLIKEPPKEFIDYPVWFIPEQHLYHTANKGTHFEWLLSYKNSSHKDNYPDSARFVIPVKKGVPVRIEVETNRGVPVIMVNDNIIHKDDAYSQIYGYEEEEVNKLPGNPLKLEIGKNGKTSLCYFPKYDGVIKIWLWLLNGAFKWPGPYKEDFYNDPVTDSIFDGISETELRHLMLLDSLSHEDIFLKAWGNVVTNRKEFKQAKVDIFIEQGDCSIYPYHDYYQSLLIGIDTLSSMLTGTSASLQNMKEWHLVNKKIDSLHSVSFKQSRILHDNGIRFIEYPIDVSLESKLKLLVNHPTIQAELIKREEVYSIYSSEEDFRNLFRMLFSYEKGELGMLSSPISMLLAHQLAKLPGINAAIYDSKGYIVAASQPFTFMNIRKGANWDIIERRMDMVSSDCYSHTGYGFKVKKVFIPIKSISDGKLVGWFMAEIYCN